MMNRRRFFGSLAYGVCTAASARAAAPRIDGGIIRSQIEALSGYDFVPYKFGAFSFTSYADKRKLIEEGLLAENDQNWKLTEAGRMAARRQAVEPLPIGR